MAEPQHSAYDREAKRLSDVVNEVASVIDNPRTIDAWRQRRMYEMVDPIIQAYRDATWLTVGDSGGDAWFLKSCGIADVTASSISTHQLSALQQQGHLPGVSLRAINIEHIDCESESFDIVFCKEAYHHLPRPAVGLYEMIRVARKCVVLCEPCDHGGRPFDWLRVKAKSILRGEGLESQMFEPVGNFIFQLSERETIKIATALSIGPLFFKNFSDFYHPRLSTKCIDEPLPRAIAKLGIGVQDGLSRLGLMSHARQYAIIWKQIPSSDLSDQLQKQGFRQVDVPRNPYTSAQEQS
jgi:ubiquinone/menaquinone biosynthesis C-methylase UbiE